MLASAATSSTAAGARGWTRSGVQGQGKLARTPGCAGRRREQQQRGGRVRVHAAPTRWTLHNAGPKTTDHLDPGEVPTAPGDLDLTATRMVLGRYASDSVSLEVCAPTVSGAHAMIEVCVAPDRVMVTDLSSTNGTFIQGQELKAGVAYELPEGGEVIFGDEYLACYELRRLD
eukprot:CAMPEP_0181357658 /NCGR_PEP_ID=MMETSP1106-20121128/5084_1 /TAXON_ID=81844 /ORGANISM="Mantoniella antarctica, Strain SL-175" /LENGTH=172 /DNA_ID=CAMNT_0023470547 /DNA_START=150 /DNA_END=668 /DNA_ORIENTATION=+